jgi:hypothetical protein
MFDTMTQTDRQARGIWGQATCGFDAGDDNLRRVVGNDPINLTDPSGLAAADIEDMAIPPSRDGSKGFVIHIEDARLVSVTVTKKDAAPQNGFGTNILLQTLLNRFTNEQIANRLRARLEQPIIDFASLPPGTTVDLERKIEVEGKEIRLTLDNQLIYQVVNGTGIPGLDGKGVYVIVSGEIDVVVGKGWIAPSMKVPQPAVNNEPAAPINNVPPSLGPGYIPGTPDEGTPQPDPVPIAPSRPSPRRDGVFVPGFPTEGAPEGGDGHWEINPKPMPPIGDDGDWNNG